MLQYMSFHVYPIGICTVQCYPICKKYILCPRRYLFVHFCCIFGAVIMVHNLFHQIGNRVECGKMNLSTIIVRAIKVEKKSIAKTSSSKQRKKETMFLISCQTTLYLWHSLHEIFLSRYNIVIRRSLKLQRLLFSDIERWLQSCDFRAFISITWSSFILSIAMRHSFEKEKNKFPSKTLFKM